MGHLAEKYFGYNSGEFINTCITLFCVVFGGLNVCTFDNIICAIHLWDCSS